MVEQKSKATIVCQPEQVQWALSQVREKQRPFLRPTDCVPAQGIEIEDFICPVGLEDKNGTHELHIFEFKEKEKHTCDEEDCGKLTCVDHMILHTHGSEKPIWQNVNKIIKSMLDKLTFNCPELTLKGGQKVRCGEILKYNDRDSHFNAKHTGVSCPCDCQSTETFDNLEALRNHLENSCSNIPYYCTVCNARDLPIAIKEKAFGELGEHECYPGLVKGYNYSNPDEVRCVFLALSEEITGLKTEMKKMRAELAQKLQGKQNGKFQ